MALDWAQLEPAIADSFAHGAIEIGVVGDIGEQSAIDAIAATFGALPERRAAFDPRTEARVRRSEEHTSELQSLMRISYAVFCLKKKNINRTTQIVRDNTAQRQNKTYILIT